MPTNTQRAEAIKTSQAAVYSTTIGKYLLDKLHSLGVDHIFGMPGDYILRFNKLMENHPIKFIGATRENTAGYMAESYGRLRGLGVACITYGVGVNIVNATAQAFVESTPLVVISGTAGTDEFVKSHLLHHLINKTHSLHSDRTQLEIFKQVTIDQAVIHDADHAASEIDRILQCCLSQKKPVYIELPRNFIDTPIMVNAVCQSLPSKLIEESNQQALNESLSETTKILHESRQPIIWIGHEIHRYNLLSPILKFAEKYRIPIVTSIMGKGTINERHPLFIGVYQGKVSRPEVFDYVEKSDCMLALGVIANDVETGIFSAKTTYPHRFFANSEGVHIDYHHYKEVLFQDFMEGLSKLNLNLRFRNDYPANIDRPIPRFCAEEGAHTTVARVFLCIEKHLLPEHIIVTDFGDSLFGSTDLTVEQDNFLSSAGFATLGFGTPGAIGAQIAKPKQRVIGIVGDGAFQMSSMELSTAIRYGADPIIIVLNNHGYGTERPIIEGDYNDILNWNYSEIPKILGAGIGVKAKTEEQFENALTQALARRGEIHIIEVELDKTDFSPTMQRFGAVVSNFKAP